MQHLVHQEVFIEKLLWWRQSSEKDRTGFYPHGIYTLTGWRNRLNKLQQIPGLGRSPGEGKGYPLQCSGLENSRDCIVHRVAKSWTRLSDSHFYFINVMVVTKQEA